MSPPGSSLLAAGLLGCTVASAQPPAWMAGCWQGESNSAAAGAFEAWSAPRAGRMLGISQTVRESGSSFEYMRIDADDRGLRFVPQPAGKPPVEFAAQMVEPDRVVFANPQHDFPKTIEYRRSGDTLTASLSAQPPGAAGRRLLFTFRRVDCDALFTTK